MRCLVIFPLFLLLTLMAPLAAEDWTTLDGKVYRNVTVSDIQDDAVTINYAGGTAKIPYYNLPLSVQKQFGQDPDSLEARKKAADEAASAGKALAERAQKIQAEQRAQEILEANKAHAVLAAKTAMNLDSPLQGTPPAPVEISTSRFIGAIYSYNKPTDTCYLDSPDVTAQLFPPPAYVSPADHVTLTFRIATPGTEPQTPDRILATVFSVSPERKFAEVRGAAFNIDGTTISLGEGDKKGGDFVSSYGQVVEYVAFYLSPDQARTIISGKVIKFTVGANTYVIDSPGMVQYRTYLAVVDKLPPPSSFIVRKFHQFINNLPPISTLIAQICIYIVVGAFMVLVFLAGSAVFVGATRFLKM